VAVGSQAIILIWHTIASLPFELDPMGWIKVEYMRDQVSVVLISLIYYNA
jgi:hypothetical protein